MQVRARWLSGAVAVLLVAAAVAWWQWPDSGTDHDLTAPRSLDAVTSAIATAVPAAQDEAQVPGVAVAVIEDGAVAWSQEFGVPADTVFEAGSISKSVAAAAILSLVDEGRLDLDRPVSAYLRTWRLPGDWPAPDQVTLRRLLSHTAGIDTPGYLGLPAEQPLPTTAESLSGAGTGTPVGQTEKPGSYAYSGGGFTIAQQVAEDVTGEPFADVVRREVLDPLGMNASGYDCTRADQAGPHDAAGHTADGSEAPRYRYAEAAAAGLCTTAADLGRFVSWLGSSDPRAVQLRTASPGTDGHYGLGVELDGSPTVGHLGVNRGFHAEYRVNPEAGVGLVVLTDGDTGGDVVEAVLRAWHDSR